MDVILDGPHVLVKEVKEGEITRLVSKNEDHKKIENNFMTNKLLVFGIGPDEYNHISTFESAKDIYDCLKSAHEGTSQFKESKADMLTTQYEAFSIKESEVIREKHTRFTSIKNELHYLGEVITLNK